MKKARLKNLRMKKTGNDTGMTGDVFPHPKTAEHDYPAADLCLSPDDFAFPRRELPLPAQLFGICD